MSENINVLTKSKNHLPMSSLNENGQSKGCCRIHYCWASGESEIEGKFVCIIFCILSTAVEEHSSCFGSEVSFGRFKFRDTQIVLGNNPRKRGGETFPVCIFLIAVYIPTMNCPGLYFSTMNLSKKWWKGRQKTGRKKNLVRSGWDMCLKGRAGASRSFCTGGDASGEAQLHKNFC